MDEDFLDVTESSKKTWLIFIFIVVGLVLFGYFFVFRKFNFGLRTIKLELGDTLSTEVKDYLTKKVNDPKEYQLDISGVNSNEVGTYSYKVSYNNITKTGKVKVEDTKAPDFELQEMIVEEGDEEYYLGNFLKSCEDLSKPCLVTLKNDKDENKFKTVGNYTIDIVVSDLYGNKKEGAASLNVVAKGTYIDPRSIDLNIVSNSKKIEDFKGSVYKKLERGINPQSDEAGDMLNEVSTIDLEAYVINNYPGSKIVSSEVIELYNKDLFIVGYSIEIIISNGSERTVYVDSSKVVAGIPDGENGTPDEGDTAR